MFFSQKSEKLVRLVIISLIFTMFPSISLFAGDKPKCPCKYKAQMIIGMAATFENSECSIYPSPCDPRNPVEFRDCQAGISLWNEGDEPDEDVWFSATNGEYRECEMDLFKNFEQNIEYIGTEAVEACLDEIYNACNVIDPDWLD